MKLYKVQIQGIWIEKYPEVKEFFKNKRYLSAEKAFEEAVKFLRKAQETWDHLAEESNHSGYSSGYNAWNTKITFHHDMVDISYERMLNKTGNVYEGLAPHPEYIRVLQPYIFNETPITRTIIKTIVNGVQLSGTSCVEGDPGPWSTQKYFAINIFLGVSDDLEIIE